MTYEESIAYLEGFTSFGIKPGLDRITHLLSRLGNPQTSYKVVHITGTNGKGSVAALMQEALLASGVRTGRFTSPHLSSYTERMRINHQFISPEAFAALMMDIKPHVDAMILEGYESPTQFEVLTAAAFLFFEMEKVMYAVVEVGLGGTLDSTNVVNPEVSVITNVTIDHTSYCGDTIEEIASHKAGIIKPHVPVVTGAQSPALEIIQKRAKAVDSPLYVFGRDFKITSRSMSERGQMVTVEGDSLDKALLFTPLLGIHQAVNLACATMAVKLLIQKDPSVSEAGMREGFARAFWPGRFEVVKALGRTFIFDGAHNAGGAESFSMAYRELFKERSKTIVFGVLEDKDIKSIIHFIVSPKDTVVTVPVSSPRSSEPGWLATQMPCTAIIANAVEQGMAIALEKTKEDDIIVVCGSLYILGEARNWVANYVESNNS